MFENFNPGALVSNNDNIIKAASDGNVALLQDSLSKGADPDYHLRDTSALQLAIANGHFEVANILIDAGANVNVRNRMSWRPIHEAARIGNLELMDKLIEKGARIYVSDDEGHSLVRVAIDNNQIDVLKKFISIEANNTEGKDKEGVTNLMAAVLSKNIEMVEILLADGCDPYAKPSNEGFTFSSLLEEWPEGKAKFGQYSQSVQEKEAIEIAQDLNKQEVGVSSTIKKRRPS